MKDKKVEELLKKILVEWKFIGLSKEKLKEKIKEVMEDGIRSQEHQ